LACPPPVRIGREKGGPTHGGRSIFHFVCGPSFSAGFRGAGWRAQRGSYAKSSSSRGARWRVADRLAQVVAGERMWHNGRPKSLLAIARGTSAGPSRCRRSHVAQRPAQFAAGERMSHNGRPKSLLASACRTTAGPSRCWRARLGHRRVQIVAGDRVWQSGRSKSLLGARISNIGASRSLLAIACRTSVRLSRCWRSHLEDRRAQVEDGDGT
jgi:hypothetical protein